MLDNERPHAVERQLISLSRTSFLAAPPGVRLVLPTRHGRSHIGSQPRSLASIADGNRLTHPGDMGDGTISVLVGMVSCTGHTALVYHPSVLPRLPLQAPLSIRPVVGETFGLHHLCPHKCVATTNSRLSTLYETVLYAAFNVSALPTF